MGFLMFFLILILVILIVLVVFFAVKFAVGVVRDMRRDVFFIVESFLIEEFDKFLIVLFIIRIINDIM